MPRARSIVVWGSISAAFIVFLSSWWSSRDPFTPAYDEDASSATGPELRPSAGERDVPPLAPGASLDPNEARVRAPEAVVTGRVVDVDYKPITDGEVQIRSTKSEALLERVQVDELGRFSLFNEKVLARVSAAFSGPGHSSEGNVHLNRGRFLELVAEALHVVRVKVVDRSGAPIVSARVHGNRRRALGDAGDGITDESGACDLIVAPGAMRIMARTDGNSYGSVAPVVVPGQDRVIVTLNRELAEVRIQVVSAVGSEHLSGASATLIPRHGIVPIRQVQAVVDGDPVVVPLKYVDAPHPSHLQGRSAAAGTDRIRFVGTLLVQVGKSEAYRVPLLWSKFEKGRQGEVLVLPVDDAAHRVVLWLRDTKGNPVRGYPFRLRRVLGPTKDGALRIPLREIEVQSDHAGAAEIYCAAGSYSGPFAGHLDVKRPLETTLVLDVTTAYGTAAPGGGYVRVVPVGREGADRNAFPRAPVEDGKWYVNLEDVVPGTTLVAQWMDYWAPLASAEVVAGGPPAHVGVSSVIEAPHNTTLRVRDGGRLVWCRSVQLDTGKSRQPRVQRTFEGLRTFDLSTLPPGEYSAEVITRDQLQYFFDHSLRVGTGEALELELQDAARVWGGVDPFRWTPTHWGSQRPPGQPVRT